ncbi:ferredoxin family protein [Alkaliphilus pronyensis]|uniref:Ferredoxin family protein n=1 Tax=Alkaliphilus pronyensis TaxID=1482732 RepID=A0A6I0FKV9_9FIRM|nr:ferredoxin family protein [Alkaliphilus pronyensis]KAB3539048.1 ferredoxin family protein [Alkaliphilus pronyensis]
MKGFLKGIWHPVIDMSKCRNCGFCYEFCPKGVFVKSNAGVEVKNHSECVDGCHGCEWKCPSNAISFPEPITREYVVKVVRWSKDKGRAYPDAFVNYAIKNNIITEEDLKDEALGKS